MPISPVSIFSRNPGEAQSLAGVSAAQLFNRSVVPLVDGLENQGDPALQVDLDNENLLATQQREERATFDAEESFRRSEADDAFLAEAAEEALQEPEQDFAVEDLFGESPTEQTAPAADAAPGKAPPKISKGRFSNSGSRAARARSGGASILLDSNAASGTRVTSPLVVIPDDHTPQQKAAAVAYTEAMARIQKERFGRTLKPRVVTRSKNGRGRSNAFHTEGFAVTDDKFVKYLRSPEGRKEYQGILRSTFGKLPGVAFHLPHSSKDPGAVNKHLGVSEVSLAQEIINDL